MIGLFVVSLSASLTLVGSGAISNGFGDTKESMGSRQIAMATPNPQPHAKGAALRDNPRRYLDEKGNRASGIKPGTAVGTKYRGERPVGASAWTSLGPPGGDVFDVAASTVDANIVLAGLRQVAALAVRFTGLVTEVTRGRRCQFWTAPVFSISSSHPTA